MLKNCIQNQKRLYLLLLTCLAVLTLMFESTCYIACAGSKKDASNYIYRRGKTTVELRVLTGKSGLATRKFNHPYYFKKTQLVDLLSSIYYLDKNLVKAMRKKRRRSARVFENDEIERLTPLIIAAFSKATIEQDLLVTSYSLRYLREGLINFFSLFMIDDKLNIVFGKVHRKGSVSKSSVLRTRNLERNVEPTKMKKSHYWELVTKPGQQFALGHKNWLIIDFQSNLFSKGVDDRTKEITAKFDKRFKPLVDPLEDRIKKLEEMLTKGIGNNKVSEEQRPIDPPSITEADTSPDYFYNETDFGLNDVDTVNIDFLLDNKDDVKIISEKFYALQELLDEELITHRNYEEKKYELLIDMLGYDVKAGLKELKELKKMGFITNSDFEKTKTELLKKL
ncbi:MAG: hypothetical protein ACUZ8H_13235 [Candidatus Anammoxibacter sp.]